MNKKLFFNIIAIISTLGILAWLATDFYGGMFIYFLSYGLLIIPIILLFLTSLVETIISLMKRGFRQNRIKVFFHALVLLAIISINLFQSDLFKSKRILTATLNGDRSYYTLILRENGSCENEVAGMLGYEKVYYGKYKFLGDTILFQKIPYDNDYIPEKLLIDRVAKVIYKERDKEGKFIKTMEYDNHFKIR